MLSAFFVSAAVSAGLVFLQNDKQDIREQTIAPSLSPSSTSFITNPPTPSPFAIPNTYRLSGGKHVFQTFNNCGPASFSMALSYYQIDESQYTLGQRLRPWQNSVGDNDDKSVTLDELAKEAENYGFRAYHRPLGNIEIVQKFVANDIPVITRTWLKPNEDIGHYRVVKGYNQTSGQILQDDSLQGKNLWYEYDEFNEIWKKFNYEYLVLIPEDKLKIAKDILKEDVNEMTAWSKAVSAARQELAKNTNDIYARFNLSVALYNIGDYQASVREFEKVENSLSSRTLWYQIEPIKAYYEVGNYDRVFEITNNILQNNNRAFSELYLLRGNIYENMGNIEAARQEYEKAVFYNINLEKAQKALKNLS